MDLLCNEHPMMPPSTPSGYHQPHTRIISNVTQLLCTEQTLHHHPAVSTKLHDDQRRLGTYLEQENRFMPNVYQMQKLLDEDDRTQMLEIIYEAVCPQTPRQSDVYHLAVNLLDRYLSYQPVKSRDELCAIASACTMISMKIRRAKKECLNYDQLRFYFKTPEKSIRVTEKAIATRLKWDLNAVTAADFIEELSRRIASVLDPCAINKLVDHSHTIANVCLLYLSFMSVPPSLLACACLCDAIQHLATDKHQRCVEILSQMSGVEQDVLLEQQRNVSEVFLKKLQSSYLDLEDTNTPTDIEGIEDEEFGQHQSHSRFDFPL